MTKKVEETKKTKSVKNTKPTRTKKNKKLYGQKTVIKNKKIDKYIIALLIISLLVNGLTIVHFITFDHKKEKIVTKIKEVIPENIVFLGDSLTYQYDLEKYYGKDLPIVNSGQDGDTTENILNNIKKRVHDYQPTTIFLLIGTNDIPSKNENEIADNIMKIIEEIKEKFPKCKIYLESVYPVNDSNNKKISHTMVNKRENEKISNLNEKLKSYTNKNKNITYIDLYHELIDEEGNINIDYTKEGLHLNDEGYKVVTKSLKKYIEKIL